MKSSIGILGLSTAITDAQDASELMGVDDDGLVNFRPGVRSFTDRMPHQGVSR